jgi:hypothetical protein
MGDDPDDLPTREELAQRVRQLEEQQQQQQPPPIGRRNVVAGLLALAGVPALAGRASAQAGGDRGSACEWLGDQNAAGYDLLGLAHTFMGEQSDTPADSDYGANEVAVYVKDDGNLYIRPNGGSEQQVSGVGGAGPWTNLGTDSDGGDNYGLPNAADNIDLQSDGAVRNADLVSADQLSVGNHPALDGVEQGREGFSGPAASSTDDFSDSKNVTEAISFDTAFPSAPSVTASLYSGQQGLVADTFNVSATGVELLVYNYSTSDRSGDTLDVAWIAAGEV